VQRHLARHLRHPLHQEVGGAHAQLDRAKRMLDYLPPLAHRPWVQIKPALDRLQHLLVLPAHNPALLGGRAAALERASVTGIGPVAAQLQPTLHVAVVVLEPLARRAAIGVLLGQVDEVLLAEAAIHFGAGGHRLGQGDGNPRLITGQDLLAIPVGAIAAVVGHLVCHDQMVFGLDRHLHIVAHHPGATPARGSRARIRVGQRDLLIWGRQHLCFKASQALHLLLKPGNLLLQPGGPGGAVMEAFFPGLAAELCVAVAYSRIGLIGLKP
jgi:hypothetical protein